MTSTTHIPALAVLLLMYGRERWLVLHRRGALRLLFHSPACDTEAIWRDAMKRAQLMAEQQENAPGRSVGLCVDLTHNFSGTNVNEFLRERLRTDPVGMLDAFSACIEADASAAVPA